MPLPRILPEQFRQRRWLSTCPTPSCTLVGRFHQGRGKSEGTRRRQHLRPAPFPHERNREPHVRRNLSGFSERQLNEVHGFTAPSAARFDCHDDESAPPCQQFGVRRLFIGPSTRQHSTIHISRIGVRFPRPPKQGRS